MSLTLALAQQNWYVGDTHFNANKHIALAIQARDQLKADVVVFSELSLTGYPPEDLLLRKAFLAEAQKELKRIMASVTDIYCVIGHPLQREKKLFNACSVIYNGKIVTEYCKTHLPNYGVFDEKRYFVPGSGSSIFVVNNIPIGLIICEDLWSKEASLLATQAGAAIIVCPNASPFEIDKLDRRLKVLKKRTQENKVPILYLNQVGAQDELVFDGGSMVIDEHGKVMSCAGFFNETMLPVTVTKNTQGKLKLPKSEVNFPNELEKVYQALVLSVRDYVNKNGFKGVLLGLSGGIDSALTICIAVDALGPEKVKAIIMPSRYTASMSLEDANQLCKNLTVQSENLSIEPAFQAFLDILAPVFQDKPHDVTEENIQARCRGVILMAMSNKFSDLVLTTGNRSEFAVGYCTLYGDMAGGFAVLKDVPKTLVKQLSIYRNTIKDDIPRRIIERPPSAELAHNQKDEDSLPAYAILDQILERYIDREQSATDIIAAGFDEVMVRKVVNLIRINEYKRRQAPIGPRLHHKAFGRDRRYPITNKFKE